MTIEKINILTPKSPPLNHSLSENKYVRQYWSTFLISQTVHRKKKHKNIHHCKSITFFASLRF